MFYYHTLLVDAHSFDILSSIATMINCFIAILFHVLYYSSSAQQTLNYWDYGRRGPDVWSRISPMCAGESQSPIDINTSRVKYEANLRPLSLNGYITNTSIHSWNFTHDGRAIVVYPWRFTSLSIHGANLNETFYLVEFRLHWGLNSRQGSEHTINGNKYPLEIQFIHRAPISRSTLILSVLFANHENETLYLNDFLEILNQTINSSTSSIQNVDLSPLFPTSSNPHYYLYQGSLTTPPCTEGVTWIVLERTVPISDDQLDVFRSNSVPSNYRFTQKLNQRQVLGNRPHHPDETGGHGHGEGGHSVSSFHRLTLSLLLIDLICLIFIH